MTQVAAIPLEFIVGTQPQQLTGLNSRAAMLDIQNKGGSGASVYVKLGAPFIQAANAKQTITFSATPDGGTWTVTDSQGNTTTNLAFNISAGSLQTALQALGAIGSNNVTVAGSMAAGFVLTFAGTLAATSQPALSVASALTLSTGQASAVQLISFSAPPTGGTFVLADWTGAQTAALAYNVTPLALAAALNALAGVNGSITNITQDPVTKAFTLTFGAPLANQPVTLLNVPASSLVTSATQASASWTVGCAPTPQSGSFCLSYGADVTTPLAYNCSAADVAAALAALPGINGAGNVAVTGTSLAAGFTVTLQGALANVVTLRLGHSSNLLNRIPGASFNFRMGDVSIRITAVTAGAGSGGVSVTPSTKTGGVAPAPVAASLVVNVPGNAKPSLEGWLIPGAGGNKSWDNEGVPIDSVWAYATQENVPVIVLQG